MSQFIDADWAPMFVEPLVYCGLKVVIFKAKHHAIRKGIKSIPALYLEHTLSAPTAATLPTEAVP